MAPVVDSPLAMGDLARRQDTSKPNFNPGSGSKPAAAFNNQLFLGLFAVIGAGMVLSSIWFFFMAKNGGFHWKKGDWEDYKSTVLRRKGPDGKTLSNATKSTKLGGGSSAPQFSDRYTESTVSTQEMREMQHHPNTGIRIVDDGRHGGRRQPSRNDPELKAYKHEKSAKVGGLNSAPSGSHFDYTNTDRSEVSDQRAADKAAKRERKERERREKQRRKEEKQAEKKARKDGKNSPAAPPPVPAHRGPPSGAYSFTTGDDASTVYTGSQAAPSVFGSDAPSSYYYTYRPAAGAGAPQHHQQQHHHLGTISEVSSRHSTPSASQQQRHQHRASNSSSPAHHLYPTRQSSPPKRNRRSAPASDAGSNSDVGTKVYPCHIPGLSRAAAAAEVSPADSVSQIGAPGRRTAAAPAAPGYRRGRARDEMSESEV